MWEHALQGFLVGLAYVAPIGMQNAYVINSAAKFKRQKAFQIALIIIFFDVALALSCFFGIGLLLNTFTFLKTIILGLGSLAVLYIGISLIRSKSEGITDKEINESLLAAAMTAFMVTWFNPQAIIDGTMLVGGFNAALTAEQGYFFILGVSLASVTWFLSLTAVVNKLRHLMTAEVLTIINRLCGIVIVFFGLKIGWQLIQVFMK